MAGIARAVDARAFLNATKPGGSGLGREILTFHVLNRKTRGQAPSHRQAAFFEMFGMK